MRREDETIHKTRRDETLERDLNERGKDVWMGFRTRQRNR